MPCFYCGQRRYRPTKGQLFTHVQKSVQYEVTARFKTSVTVTENKSPLWRTV